MPQIKNRVKETTTTTGTGSLSLGGAATGFVSFNTAFGTNSGFPYAVSSASGSEWEVGRGYLSASTTLVRETVLDSSNSGAAVNFSAGTKDVYNPFNAEDAMAASEGNQLLVNKAQGWN